MHGRDTRPGKRAGLLSLALFALAACGTGEGQQGGEQGAPPPTQAAGHGPDPAFAEQSRRLIDEYLRTHSVRRLQIGAGSSRFDGWLNTDIEQGEGLAYLDATERFPLEDASFDYVASEHVIEHVSFEGGMNMLAESFRVLKPGGKVRVATPNLQRFLALFEDPLSDEARDYLAGKLAWHDWPTEPRAATIILNLQMHSWGHRFLYDPETLRSALARTGFESIQQFAIGESDDPELADVEGRLHSSVAHLNEYETMVFQAVKPRAQ